MSVCNPVTSMTTASAARAYPPPVAVLRVVTAVNPSGRISGDTEAKVLPARGHKARDDRGPKPLAACHASRKAQHMSVTLQHPRVGELGTVVVSGIANAGALEHLCRSLSQGAVFDHARLVVVDITALPPGDDLVLTLRDVAGTLAGRHQCLAVVDGCRRSAHRERADAPVTYPDLRAALRAGDRYFRCMSGTTSTRALAGDLADAIVAIADLVVRCAVGMVAGTCRKVSRRP
jgi:hypothetical protein